MMYQSKWLAVSAAFMMVTLCLAQEARRAPRTRATRASDVALTRVVYIVRHSAAKELAQTLSQVMGPGERVVVGPNTVSNGLIISAPEKSIKELVALLEALDVAPQRISLEITIGKLNSAPKAKLSGSAAEVAQQVKNMTASGQLEILTRASLSTLANQQAFVQVGEQLPVPTGSNFGGRSRVSTSYSNLSVGTLVRAIARVVGDEIVMDLGVERSAVVKPKKAKAADDRPAPPATITSATGQSTVRVKNGHTVMLSSFLVSRDGKNEGHVVLVTARINK